MSEFKQWMGSGISEYKQWMGPGMSEYRQWSPGTSNLNNEWVQKVNK